MTEGGLDRTQNIILYLFSVRLSKNYTSIKQGLNYMEKLKLYIYMLSDY